MAERRPSVSAVADEPAEVRSRGRPGQAASIAFSPTSRLLRPYRQLGEALDLTEQAVMDRAHGAAVRAIIRQVSAIFDTKSLG